MNFFVLIKCYLFQIISGIQVGRNIIHGSDAVDSANKEIALWFQPAELVSWKPANADWIYE